MVLTSCFDSYEPSTEQQTKVNEVTDSQIMHVTTGNTVKAAEAPLLIMSPVRLSTSCEENTRRTSFMLTISGYWLSSPGSPNTQCHQWERVSVLLCWIFAGVMNVCCHRRLVRAHCAALHQHTHIIKTDKMVSLSFLRQAAAGCAVSCASRVCGRGYGASV